MISDASIDRAEIAGLPPDRLAARLLAHALIEQTQVAPRPALLDRLIAQAAAAGWGDVQVSLLHSRLLLCSLTGEGSEALRAVSDQMIGVAESTADEILIGLALAARALFVTDGRADEAADDTSDLLARAVAMLDDAFGSEEGELGLRAIELPAGYVECGQVFHRLALWELEEQMYVRAAASLELPLPPEVAGVYEFTRRVLVVNRLESAAALACALLEVGDRARARVVAAGAVRPTPAQRADLPPLWVREGKALERLLDVIADRPDLPGGPTGLSSSLYAELSESTWAGYRACLLLAAAVGHHDRREIGESAALAEQALCMLDDYKPSFRTLALCLAAENVAARTDAGQNDAGQNDAGQPGRDGAALRYARHLAELRWQTRLAVLGAVRSRLGAARMLRQGEQLNRQAYVDALTGLANRHAETRHLARLRRCEPRERLAVVLVDVDHFKAVNDTFGHAAGDDVLRVIGAILLAAVRTTDLAVRLGGDEFMLLIDLPPGRGPVPALAEDVIRLVTRHRWDDIGAGLRVGISAGQAAGAARDVDQLIREADDNLYRAKGAGRGRAVAAQSA
jgi:diguanylate cyclase (GGDEF)-like protein